MGIGISIFFIAVGAILEWGINVHHTSGVDLSAIGGILMVVGAIGLLVSMVIFGTRRRDTVVTEREVV